jgi:hypothetical protein
MFFDVLFISGRYSNFVAENSDLYPNVIPQQALKLLLLTVMDIGKKWTMQIRNWGNRRNNWPSRNFTLNSGAEISRSASSSLAKKKWHNSLYNPDSGHRV